MGHNRLSWYIGGHCRFKAIATAWNRLDQALPVVPQRPPQLPDALYQSIVRDGDVRPDRSHQLVLRDQTAVILDQELQNRERLRSEHDLGAVQRETAAIQVEDVAIELQAPSRHYRRSVAVATGHC